MSFALWDQSPGRGCRTRPTSASGPGDELGLGAAAARSLRGDSQAIRLDVTDQSSIIAATRRIENTWGPANEMRDGDKVSRATVDNIRLVFETNVFGVVAVMQAMLPLLRKAPAARIVNVFERRWFPHAQGRPVGLL
ncbi:SDR family NAD(P)-dependent oxidoreductase [Paraburkholderia youngii]|uniref:SDR family NAD(P)-dependent oxidoreductase n=1 Tax=Paraburkholderia youngii TaxID=2782701 RepID=UPI003D1BDA14